MEDIFKQSSIIHDLIEQQQKELEAQKWKLLEQRISDRVPTTTRDPFVSMDEESRRRFPRIAAFSNHAGTQEWYFNNGTPEGILLITFFYSAPKWAEYKCTVELNYK